MLPLADREGGVTVHQTTEREHDSVDSQGQEQKASG